MRDVVVLEGDDLRFRYERMVEGQRGVRDALFYLLKAKKEVDIVGTCKTLLCSKAAGNGNWLCLIEDAKRFRVLIGL